MDLIDRQAAIDAINTWDKFGVDERSRVVRWCEGLEPYVHLRDVLTAIVNLPSAQSKEVFEIGKPYPLKGYEFCIFKDAYGDDWVVIKKYINDIEEGQV